MAENFTAVEKLKEVERELAMRKRVWSEPMGPQQQKRFAIMQAIAADYRVLVQGESLL